MATIEQHEDEHVSRVAEGDKSNFLTEAVQELGENVPKCGEQLRAEVPKTEDGFQDHE